MNCNPHSHRQRRALQTQIEREVKTFFRAAGVVHIFTTSAGSNTKLRQLITPNFGRVISGGPLSRIINRKIGLENG